jgi:acetolactate synthase-1/2/3 large subunit
MQEFVKNAALIFAIGTDFGEPDSGSVFDNPKDIPAKLIRIDIDPEQLTRNRSADVAIFADTNQALKLLNDTLASSAIFSVEEKWQAQLQAVRQETADFVGNHPEMQIHKNVFSIIDKTLDNPIIVGDNTQPIFTSNYVYESPAPRSYFNSGTGFCTLGYAMPASIGAKLGRGDRPVVSITGDGGFMFTLPEIATAVEQGLPIVVIVWNNTGYREIEKFMVDADSVPVGVKLHTPNFSLLAEAFGCDYAEAISLASFESALQRSKSADRPIIIEVNEPKLVASHNA